MTVSVVVRRFAATPARSAADAWTKIVELIAPPASEARRELDHVAGIGMSLIAAEAMSDSPIVVYGVGPQFRAYCLYDEEAILGEGVSEEPLSWCPTDGDWAMSMPCPPEDLPWVQPALARVSSRVTARDLGDRIGSGAASEKAVTDESSTVDLEAFFRR